ncbi:hypothetical protein M5K25_000571 [Dendrobium thyrsiflorum]|uniref:Uncharacterized protein n=1 Tax=Dendrobium thyrsiflorum TaxID=117978 RepID=A0ABD0W7Z9_DENTH
MFRMSQTILLDLAYDLEIVYDLHGSSRTTAREFSIGLEALVKLSSCIVKPIDPSFESQERFCMMIDMSYFKYQIGQSLLDNEGDVTNHEAQDGEDAKEMIQLREQITSTLLIK